MLGYAKARKLNPRAIAERIVGAELVEIGDASHLSVIEQPAVFSQQIQRFLTTIEPAH